MKYIIFIIIFMFIKDIAADIPCAPRYINSSLVCVCNNTYCDTITREVPKLGYYVTYTTSKSGLRLSKNLGVIEARDPENENGNFGRVLELNLDRKYQIIEGFGGSVSDATGINWRSLPKGAQQRLIDSYFSKDGIEYNMIRVPCGSSDFSTHFWAYNEVPYKDKELSNFKLSREDKQYKVPMIQACIKAATAEVKVLSSIWSPPKWMLSEDRPSGFRSVKEEFYQVFAEYSCKFAELYKTNGINIWGMSAVNEPILQTLTGLTTETLRWTVPDMAKFMGNNFGPTMRNCSVEGIRILGVEDERYTVPLWFNDLEFYNSKAIDYIDGVAVHFYRDVTTSPAVFPRAMRKYPNKFVLATEGCVEIAKGGSWEGAKQYILDILEDLNYNLVGWIDWNMCLNQKGGPNWMKVFANSPIIVNANKKEFYKQSMFYVMGHFSKFIPAGSQRIQVLKTIPALYADLDLQDIEAMGQELFDNVAFVTPRGTIVVVIHNDGPKQDTAIRFGEQQISLCLEEEAITTIEFTYK